MVVKYPVDIEAGNAFVKRLKEKAPSIGGFNGMFRVPSGYEKLVLVSGTDGGGTKMNLCRVAMDYTTTVSYTHLTLPTTPYV